MENKNKTVIHTVTLNSGLVNISLYFISVNRNLLLQKRPNAKGLKIKYQQNGVKLKCLIDKRAINKILFSTTLTNKILLLRSIYLFSLTSQKKWLDKPVFR